MLVLARQRGWTEVRIVAQPGTQLVHDAQGERTNAREAYGHTTDDRKQFKLQTQDGLAATVDTAVGRTDRG